MYTRLIVPFDGSTHAARAIPVARKLAAAMNAPLRIVGFSLTSTYTNDMRESMHHLIDGLGELEEVACSWRVDQVDDVVMAIAKELAEEPGALICMTSAGRSRSAPVLGSVADGVLRETFGPTLLVGPQVDPERFNLHGKLLICTDGSDTSRSILPIAAQWAIALPLDPWIISVRSPTDATVPADSDLGAESAYVGHVAHELARDIGRPVQHDTLHHKRAARALVELAKDNASLIAMSTHGRTGLSRLAMGSVAMDVVHHATCPVLLHRPPHLVV